MATTLGLVKSNSRPKHECSTLMSIDDHYVVI
jgi:hypothetical protein